MKKTIMFLGVLSLGLAHAQQEGKVGINTETPSATLNVKSKTGTSGATKNFELENANGTKMVTVRDNGKVGIGTEIPREQLHVVGGIRSELNRLPDGIGGFIEFVNPSKSGAGNEAKAANWRIYNMTGNYSNGLHFYGYPENDATRPISALSSLLVLADTGNIGISETNPSQKLDVRGNARLRELPNVVGANTDKVVVVDNTGVLKSVERSTLAGDLKATPTASDTEKCTDAKAGSIHYNEITQSNGKKKGVFAFCTKNTEGQPIWFYFSGGQNSFPGTATFGENLPQ